MATEDKAKAWADLADLAKQLEDIIKNGKEAAFSEADVSSKFILPFLRALGWDISNIDQVKEQRRTLSGPVDYSLSINRKPKLLLELKKFDEQLDGYREVHGNRETFAEQATRYAWHLKVEWVVLTNFKELRLYNSYYRKPIDGLRLQLRFTQFASELDKLWILSRASVETGELDKIEKKAERKNIDEAVLNDLLEIRNSLSERIPLSNSSLPIPLVRESIQKIIDRLLVIRVSEDRGLIGFESLRKELDSWKGRGLPTPFMRSLKSLFRDFDDVYNTKLFAPHRCEDLFIENDVIEKIINIFYQYNFDLISADLLGAIYESYLGHVLEETTSGGVQITESAEARKKEGIYYTPTHLVEYVVISTLGELLKKCKSPDEVAKIKILDPACGSGSFLIKAFDVIKQWYDNYNLKLTPKNHNLDSHFQKITDIERRILSENLFGVDIDPEAAEIAAVNLMLKAMKRGEKLPQILGQNIRIGNSLVNGEEEEFDELSQVQKDGLKPFNWESEFPNVLSNGGFDIIIGNPPYFKIRRSNPIRISSSFSSVKTGPVNAAMMFIELATRLAKNSGRIGLVIPKMLTYTKGWKGSRAIVFRNKINSIIDCQQAFEGVLLEQILLTLEKNPPEKSHIYNIGEAKGLDIVLSNTMPQGFAEKNDFLFIEPLDIAYRIREKTNNGALFLARDNICDIILGEGIQSLPCWHPNPEIGDLPILRGDDIQMWHIRGSLFFSPTAPELEHYKKDIDRLHVPHIVAQRIVAHIRYPKPHIILMVAYDGSGSFAFNTVTHFLVKDPKFNIKFILGLLNSKLLSFYAYKFIYNNAIRSMDLYEDYAGRLPIKSNEQNEIVSIVDSILSHFQKAECIKPIYRRYLTEKTVGTREFNDYYRRLTPNQRDPKDSETVGVIKKLVVEETGNWLNFKVDYLDKRRQLIITDHSVLRCEIENRAVRIFLKEEINKKGPQNRAVRLIDKILSIQIPCFNKDNDQEIELINMQLTPFLNDLDAQVQWIKELQKLDNKLNKKVYALYGLNDEEIKHIEENSKPSGWYAE